jgi:CubicO group peptidase (beta-lactamase class C family)
MTSLSKGTRKQLHRIVAERQRKFRVPGIAAGVGRDGALVWSDGVGAADIETPDSPPTDDTQFLVASHTKTFTAVLVMALRDEGKLSLEDPVESYIPESKHGGVTIRQMLSHVTGMQREPVGDVWDTLTYPDRDELITGWNAAEKILKPHFKWHYSNLVFSVLGEIVARVDGREWAESLQARILDPLEMRRTTVGLAGNAAVGYYVPPFSDVPVLEPVLDTKALDPAGGLASTLTDMVAWGSFLADPTDDVLSADTVEEMCQPQIMADLDRWQLAWGLGLMLVRDNDRVWVGHTGGMPGHITGLVVQRQTKTVGVVLMNSTAAPDPAAFAVELGGYVIDNEPLTAPVWRPGTAVPAELTGVLGQWFSEGRPITFSVSEGHLEAKADGQPDWMPPSVFVRLANDVYRTESGRETGELLRITRDEGGVVVRLNWATYRFTREPLAFGEWL